MRSLARSAAALLALGFLLSPLGAQSYVYLTHPQLPFSGGCYPFNCTLASVRYQTFFHRKYLPRAPIRITDIAFGATIPFSRTFEATQFEVRMAHNTVGQLNKVFASNFSTPAVTLYAGKMKYPVVQFKWADLGLTKPFFYDGVSHLVLEMRWRNRIQVGNNMAHDVNLSRVICLTGSDPFSSATGIVGGAGLMTRLTCDLITLKLAGAPAPGGSITLTMEVPSAAGRPFQAASSLGKGPIPCGARAIGLADDDLMKLSAGGLVPTVFVNFCGFLDSRGKAVARVNIPRNPLLKGLRVYSAFVTLDRNAPRGIDLISGTQMFIIH